MDKIRLLGISGSLRNNSTNSLLLREAARRLEQAELIEADLRLPLFDQDLQDAEGIPDSVRILAEQIAQADAVIVAGPEYNKGISGVLKNALDWVSRTGGNPWRDKPVALVSAAAGRAGGERSQNMTRLCLTPFRPRLIAGPEVFIGNTAHAWTDAGRLKDERAITLLDELMGELRREIARAAL